MKIISKFKDYYDFLSREYGQDENIIFKRDYLAKPTVVCGQSIRLPIEINSKEIERGLPSFKENVEYISICGKLYPIAYVSKDAQAPFELKPVPFPKRQVFNVACGANIGYKIEEVKRVFYIKDQFITPKPRTFLEEQFGRKDRSLHYTPCDFEDMEVYPGAFELHKRFNTPILSITGRGYGIGSNHIKVDCDAPILRDTPIPGVLDAQTIYQEISYFIANVLRESPDAIPASAVVNQSDPEKIESHGFDIKKSFRHRKSITHH